MPYAAILKFLSSDAGKLILSGLKWLVIIGFIAGTYFYVQNLRDSVAELEKTNEAMELQIEQKNQEIEGIRSDFTTIQSKIRGIEKYQSELDKDFAEFEEIFSKMQPDGSKRDIGVLALAKPKMIEKRINSGTVEFNRCIEIATGATPEKDEKNSICPSILGKRVSVENNK